jgi:hypothetical protein
MKNKAFVSLFILGSLLIGGQTAQAASLSTDGAQAQSSIAKMTSIDELNDLIRSIKDKIKTLKKEKKNNSSKTGENLSISGSKLLYPAGTDFGSAGNVVDQKITVIVKNNEFGAASLTGEKVKYEIYLYDVTKSKKKLFKAATGEFLVPYANGYSEFEAFIEGGQPFDGENFEKKYRALIKIDTSKDIKESNEKDNEAWSDEWLITYYKG